MVLFVFVIMMLNQGPHAAEKEGRWIHPRALMIPVILGIILLGELIAVFLRAGGLPPGAVEQAPQLVGKALFGP
ncbi:MAG TPA: NADH-quinone oxidoreductase subunit J, partial [Armatimonadota bacterium]